jgi:2-polyprenyl-3-methyl-5-hydroxy-6-metoxy-1,4-benzoquinol methylase
MLDNGEDGDPDYEASYTYESYSPRHARTLMLIDQYAENESILDIGANTGLLLHEIKNRIPRLKILKGVDVDSKAIDFGVKKYGIDLEAIDAALLKETHDNIVLAHTLEHIAPLPGFVNLLDRLLNPGGRVFIAVPNIEALGASKMVLPWWPALQPAQHVWYFSAETLTNAFSRLKPDWSVDYIGSFPIWKPKHIPSFLWKKMQNTEDKRRSFMQSLKGDQLDFVISKSE